MEEYRPGKFLVPQLLRERNIDPVDFYTKMGISKQHYSAYVTGKRTMSIGKLKTAASYFGLPMDDLYEWIEIH